MAAAHFRLPQPLNINDSHLAHSYVKWKKELDVYLVATKASTESADIRRAIILQCAGPDFTHLDDSFKFDTDEDRKNPDKLLEKIHEYCTRNQTVVTEAWRFWTIKLCEPFDVFLQKLTRQAAYCGYGGLTDRLICDKIVFSMTGCLLYTSPSPRDA